MIIFLEQNQLKPKCLRLWQKRCTLYNIFIYLYIFSEVCHKTLANIHKMVSEIYALNVTNDTTFEVRRAKDDANGTLLPPMPLKSVKDFDEFEALLAEDSQTRRQLVCSYNF